MRAAPALLLACSVCSVRALAPTARAINNFARRCVKQESACLDESECAVTFGALDSFHAVDELPLPSSWDVETRSDIEELTGLSRSAFQPTMPIRKPPSSLEPQTAAFVEPSAQLTELSASASMLVGAAMGMRIQALDALRNLDAHVQGSQDALVVTTPRDEDGRRKSLSAEL